MDLSQSSSTGDGILTLQSQQPFGIPTFASSSILPAHFASTVSKHAVSPTSSSASASSQDRSFKPQHQQSVSAKCIQDRQNDWFSTLEKIFAPSVSPSLGSSSDFEFDEYALEPRPIRQTGTYYAMSSK